MKTARFFPYVFLIGMVLALTGIVELGLAQALEQPEGEMQP